MPYFHSTGAPAEASSQGGWKLPSLWGKPKPAAQTPHIYYQPPVPAPTTTQRLGMAISDNRVSNFVGEWITPEKTSTPNPPEQRPDALSLTQSVGEPTPKLYIVMAQVKEAQGDADGARGLYQKAIAAGPKNAQTLRQVGHFEDRQGRLPNAEALYQQAATIAPQDGSVLNDLALCLARQGKLRPAAEVLHRAIRLAPEKSLYRNNMATVLMELGEQQEAMLHLMAAHPPAAAFFNMGHLLEKAGKSTDAATHYSEAMRLDPTMQAAQQAFARTSPVPAAAPQVFAPQMALVPRSPAVSTSSPASPTFTPAVTPEPVWPSEPITVPAANEPTFGPRLLPPAESRTRMFRSRRCYFSVQRLP